MFARVSRGIWRGCGPDQLQGAAETQRGAARPRTNRQCRLAWCHGANLTAARFFSDTSRILRIPIAIASLNFMIHTIAMSLMLSVDVHVDTISIFFKQPFISLGLCAHAGNNLNGWEFTTSRVRRFHPVRYGTDTDSHTTAAVLSL